MKDPGAPSRLGAVIGALDDPAVRATAASRVVQLVGAPVTLYLAATRLPPRSQGYFIVLVNIVALAQLFELGLGTIIVQFASHEWPRLRWGRNGGLEGDPSARDSVAGLTLAAIRWFGIASFVVFAVAGIGGVALYGGNATGRWLDFAIMWTGVTALAAVYLAFIPFICIAEGCGDLLAVQRMRTLQSAGVLVGLWTGITMFNALFAAWFAASAQLGVALIWIIRRHRGLLRAPRSLPAQLFEASRGLVRRYQAEQRRSAMLWLALHLAPQLLAPTILFLRGGDEAGRLGMTLAIALAPATIATAWLHGRYPALGTLVAQGKLAEFDALARRATVEAVGVFAACAAGLVLAVLALPAVLPQVAARLLPVAGLAALFAGSLVIVLLQAMAGYVRAFRDDSLAPWIVAACTVVVVASVTGAVMGGTAYLVFAYATSALVFALPTVAARFVRERRTRLGQTS